MICAGRWIRISKKYLLITVDGREIYTQGFDELSEAQYKMKQELIDFGYAPMDYNSDSDESKWGIGNMYGYSDVDPDRPIDWLIVDLEEL